MKKLKFNFVHLFLFSALFSVIVAFSLNIHDILNDKINLSMIIADLLFCMGFFLLILFIITVFLVTMGKIKFKGITLYKK